MKAVAEPINKLGGKTSFNPGDLSTRSYSNSLDLAVTCSPRMPHPHGGPFSATRRPVASQPRIPEVLKPQF